jgi:putative ABC transport system permease protein
MQQWLENFEYKIDIGVGVFAGAVLASLLIALLTVSYQSVKAALMNPVESLRNE